MSENMQIPLEDLRSMCALLIKYLKQNSGEMVTLDKDYFWSIPQDEKYNVYAEPKELTIGQVSESWQNLEDSLSSGSEIFPHHFIWLADVLAAIAAAPNRVNDEE